MEAAKNIPFRHRDQIDLPNGARIWPTYWARSPHVAPDTPQQIHPWNANSPKIGFIDNITTKERAELIVSSVNSASAAEKLAAKVKLYLGASPSEAMMTFVEDNSTWQELINLVAEYEATKEMR